jgi:hypothetical protein
MTRAIAIFLIAIHLMNIIGNYGIIINLETIHQKEISEQLNEDKFAGSAAITLRIPFSLPYSTHSENYERVSGRIEYEGQVYQLVKQKFHNDTLFIVCVEDARLTEIKDVFKNFAASMNDTHDGSTSGKTVNMQVKDFETCAIVQLSTALFQLEFLRLPDYTFSVKVNSESPLDQPPRA